MYRFRLPGCGEAKFLREPSMMEAALLSAFMRYNVLER
jgi:hypothetical protein